MTAVMLIHILAGGLGLTTGFVALSAAKGAPLHRRAGIVFVYAMVGMCAAGIGIAIYRGAAPAINIPAALLTGTFAVTALVAVRPPSRFWRLIHVTTMLITLGVGIVCLRFAFEAVTSGGSRNGMPAFPFFLFGGAGMLAATGDVRMLLAGELRGTQRIVRHLWRMSFALMVAALSFFIGQADVFPPAIRIMPLLALPVLAVIITMFYWLWRVSVRRSLRGLLNSRGGAIDTIQVASTAREHALAPSGLAAP